MFKYKSHCRFPMLISVNNEIIEIRPNQILELDILIDHPNILLLKNKQEDITEEKQKGKLNGNNPKN